MKNIKERKKMGKEMVSGFNSLLGEDITEANMKGSGRMTKNKGRDVFIGTTVKHMKVM